MSDTRSTLFQLLAQRAGGDPMAQLHHMLRARMEQRPPGDPVRELLGRMLQPQLAMQARPDPNALLRAAHDMLNLLQARNAALAVALGACPACWGTDPTCRGCGGAGRSGWVAPDPAAFATWIAPAVAAMAAGDALHDPDRPQSPSIGGTSL